MKNKNLLLGVVLICIGALWFLDNLGFIDYSPRYLVNSIADLWPLLIVILGAGMIINNKTADRILWVLFFLVILVYSFILQYGNPLSNNMSNNKINKDTYSYPLTQSVSNGELDIDIGAAKFTLDKLSETNLIELDSNIDELYVDVSGDENLKSVKIDNKGNMINIGDSSENELDLYLNSSIDWDIEINTGAVDSDLDFSGIKTNSLKINLGAGKMKIKFGDTIEHTNFVLKSGVSDIAIYIPKESALKINMAGALNSTNLDQLNLDKNESTYISEGYAGAENTIDMNIEMGLGKLTFFYY
ncbi:LiaI-LiaF-like domain-containing protein [Alkalibacter mobilis]|uniref:LiaI-LiaF-like domain-containing protein n=1 Tax=Alkalibacter mobilis TaxID=2787712 RepID=UPI00189C94F2|nr:hypothetical protein [Alkalibacter mobilis]